MITAAGRYALSIDAYHHDPKLCDGPSISASGLKQIAECPAKYWAFSPLNPKRIERKDSKALDLGRAAHALVLGEPEFACHFIISPFDDFRKADAREWRDAQTLTILKAEDFETVRAMAAAQLKNPDVMSAFTDGDAEISLIFKDEETGVWLKSRPDWLPRDLRRKIPVDYKSTVSLEPHRISGDAFKFGYPSQAALQIDAIEAVIGIKPETVAHVIQEKDAPYLSGVRLFTLEQLDYGRKIYRRALRTFADCLASGKWPGYTDGPAYYDTPGYIAKKMEEFDYEHDDRDGGPPLDRSRSYTVASEFYAPL